MAFIALRVGDNAHLCNSAFASCEETIHAVKEHHLSFVAQWNGLTG